MQYLRFGSDIKLLGDSLKRLEKIVENADSQRPRRPWHNNDADHSSSNTLQDVTGDFLSTLNDCQTLLDDNSRFHRSSGNCIDNVYWWGTTEREVNSLHLRIRFHLTKITFISKPFEQQLLLGIQREVKQLRREIGEIKTILIQDVRLDEDASASSPSVDVPEDLALRFKDALYENAPRSFKGLGQLPLKESFDAIVLSFANSTIDFNARTGLGQNIPEEPQYLNLIKARWLVEQLEDSYEYRAAGPYSLWADYMRELKDDIRDQFLRFDAGKLFAPPLDTISRLPDSCFAIWVVEERPPRPPDLAEQRLFEEKILELTLPVSYGNRQSALTIFRKSDVDFRLVSTTIDEQNKDFHREEEKEINMHSTRLIPAYASPDASRPTNNIMLWGDQAQGPKWYSLPDAPGIARFQQALTGYRVFHEMSNVYWSIEGSSKPHKSGRARLQLWHYKPLPSISRTPKIDVNERKPSILTPSKSPDIGVIKVNRVDTRMSGATFISGQSPTSSPSISSITSPVNGPRGEGTALMRPEVPVLIMMTLCERKYTLLHVQCR